jgi:hypothetical protein
MSSSPTWLASRAGWHELKPPLSRDLRDSGGKKLPPYPFGELAVEPAAFQSAINLRSFCLRGSGAVAPSAPANFIRNEPVSSADLDWREDDTRAGCEVNAPASMPDMSGVQLNRSRRSKSRNSQRSQRQSRMIRRVGQPHAAGTLTINWSMQRRTAAADKRSIPRPGCCGRNLRKPRIRQAACLPGY